jgi:hypothetical protein
MVEQLDFFHLLDDQASEFICDTCLFDINGCCSFNEPLGRYCTLGDSKIDINTPVDQMPRITAKRIADYIGKKLKIDFHEKYRGDGRLIGKTKNNTVDIYLDQYPEDVFNGEKFIGVCIDRRDKLGGLCCGCSTVKEVIDLIQKREADNETD